MLARVDGAAGDNGAGDEGPGVAQLQLGNETPSLPSKVLVTAT